MNDIREKLNNAKMAYTNMSLDIDGKKMIKSIFDIIEEDKESIKKANAIDIKNNNGFEINFDRINQLQNETGTLEDSYRKVISMNKNENNYLEGKQTDNLGTICVIYNGNTYCLLELAIKAILTHNAIIFASEREYMKGTNELVLILIRRILKAYNIDANLVQILYTNQFEELLANNASINKVIVLGDKKTQQRIKEISKVEVICNGYDNFDMYIEDTTHLSFIQEIYKQNKNLDIYIKRGIENPFEDYIEVEDLDEAIGMINLNSAGYSVSIFTDNTQNATQFLREVKAKNISVNSSPLIESGTGIDIEDIMTIKNMMYPNPLGESTEKNKIEFPTERAILEKNKMEENNAKINEKEDEINSLKKQLEESQKLANKYMNVFRKSFFSRLFGRLSKDEIDKDTKMLS